MDTQETIKTRIKTLRGEGIPPARIAREAGVPQPTLSKFLNGKGSLSPRVEEKLSTFFENNYTV